MLIIDVVFRNRNQRDMMTSNPAEIPAQSQQETVSNACCTKVLDTTCTAQVTAVICVNETYHT